MSAPSAAAGDPGTRSRTFIVYRELLLLAAIVLGSAGMTLMARSGLGVSVVSSVPYVFSLQFPQLTFGTWTFISFVVVILLSMALTRNFERFYLFSLVVSLLNGVCNDLFKALWSLLPESQLPIRIVWFLCGWFLLATGISSFIKCGLPPGPYELIVSEMARLKGVPVARGKTILDLTSLTISLLFIAFVLRRLAGIGPGTVVAGLFNGTLVGFFIRQMDRRFEMKPLLFKERRSRADT